VLALVVSLSCLGDTYPLPEGAADEEIDAPSVIREVLEPLLGDYPGIAYAVGRGDSLLFAGGIGLADLAKDVPITATTRFRLYSVIKPITATALLAMADSGRLEVETRVDRILTGRSGSVGTVSLRHLAGHLSGIRDYRDGEWMEVSRSHCETPDDAVRRFGSDPLESRPGERYSYSSFNYVLLSAVIQRVAGEPFDRVLDSLVLEPAGATGIRPEAGPGPAVVDVGTRLRLVLIDTQWWLHGGPRPEGGNGGCVPGSPSGVVDSLRGALRDAGARHVAVLGHHPLATGGPHGGHFTWRDHLFPLTEVVPWLWLPLPVIGSAYPLARQNGWSDQDLSGRRNKALRDSLTAAFADRRPLVYAAGHEHALQVLDGGAARHLIVSGAGRFAHTSPVTAVAGTRFAASVGGFARLDVLTDGRVRLSVVLADATGRGEERFAMWLDTRTGP